MPAMRDAIPGNEVLKRGCQHVDDDVRPFDLTRTHRGVVYFESNPGASGMSTHTHLRRFRVNVTNGHEPIVMVGQLEQVVDEIGRALAGTQDEDMSHGSASSGWIGQPPNTMEDGAHRA
jgi:hypothetical protein